MFIRNPFCVASRRKNEDCQVIISKVIYSILMDEYYIIVEDHQVDYNLYLIQLERVRLPLNQFLFYIII